MVPVLASACDGRASERDAELSRAQARAARDATVWADEVEAQRHEATIVRLWDELRGSSDKLASMAAAPFTSLQLAQLGAPVALEHGVERREMQAQGDTLDRAGASSLAASLSQQGFVVHETEWHHSRFEPASRDSAARSSISFALHVSRASEGLRMILRGDLSIEWAAQVGRAPAEPVAMSVSRLELLQRAGAPVFQELAAWPAPRDGARSGLLEPILLRDLDGDGFTDIVQAAANRVSFNQGDGSFRHERLCEEAIAMDAALLADFNGDGALDLLSAANDGLPQLFTRREQGVFVDPQSLDAVAPALTRPMAITAGDIDADGDLDIFLGQYKLPYVDGQMPTPFYDANDGYPSYLLVNMGDGRFVDNTQAAGLAAKRLRRTYSASFVDLDDDADLDLLVVSDFAGFDMYLNDGSGHFADVTAERFGDGHDTFGMSHTFTDANNDGLLDFLVVGMSSTTARRLDQLGLGRDDAITYRERRAGMGYGNRLYLGQGGGRYEVASNNDRLARTGWSWGTTDFDLENDGDRELFVVNGHVTGASAADYCTTFWTHDLYDGTSAPDPELRELFGRVMQPLVSGQASWNGYEKNTLLQRMGSDWVSTGFLFGIAQAFDARAAASADFDNDGRADLLVIERTQAPDRHDVLHVYGNRFPSPGNWLGVRLLADAPNSSPLGATLRVTDSSGRVQRQLITSGDSHRTQHDSAVIFGLGSESVDRLEVTWADGGRVLHLEPEPRSYVELRASERR